MTTVQSEQARQGGKGRRVLIILLVALVLAGLAAIVLEFFDRDAVDADIGEPGIEFETQE